MLFPAVECDARLVLLDCFLNGLRGMLKLSSRGGAFRIMWFVALSFPFFSGFLFFLFHLTLLVVGMIVDFVNCCKWYCKRDVFKYLLLLTIKKPQDNGFCQEFIYFEHWLQVFLHSTFHLLLTSGIGSK